MYFLTYGLPKKWLDNCLKRPVSDYLLTGKMVNGWKHCFNLSESTFTIFRYHCEGN